MKTLAEMKQRLRELGCGYTSKTKRSNDDGCDCDCDGCEADDCENCSMAGCDDPECAAAGCPSQAIDRMDAEMNSLRRLQRFVNMRHSPDTQLMAMRERRRKHGRLSGNSRDYKGLAAEYRASLGGQPERREFRSSISVDSNRIVGYAAVFNSMSEPMKFGNRSFRERILPGAFDRCLQSNPDIRGLINHDPSLLLARTTSGTMSVKADGRGLQYTISPPATSYANDLLVSLRRGDIDASSFGFYTTDDDWTTDESGETIREIVSADVFDCSVVTFPAYNAASSGIA